MNITTVMMALVARFFESICSLATLAEYYRQLVEQEIDEVMRLKAELAYTKQELRAAKEYNDELELYTSTIERDNMDKDRAINTLEQEHDDLRRWYRDLEEQFERIGQLTIGHTYTYTESGFTYTGLVVRVEYVGTRIVRWIKCRQSGKVYTESQFNAMAAAEIRRYIHAVRWKVGEQYRSVVEHTTEAGPQWEAAGKQVEEELAWLLAGTPGIQGNWVHRN